MSERAQQILEFLCYGFSPNQKQRTTQPLSHSSLSMGWGGEAEGKYKTHG